MRVGSTVTTLGAAAVEGLETARFRPTGANEVTGSVFGRPKPPGEGGTRGALGLTAAKEGSSGSDDSDRPVGLPATATAGEEEANDDDDDGALLSDELRLSCLSDASMSPLSAAEVAMTDRPLRNARLLKHTHPKVSTSSLQAAQSVNAQYNGFDARYRASLLYI